MLRSLCEEVARLVPDKSSLSSSQVAAKLQDSPLFHRAVLQLISTDVEGCSKDLQKALQFKTHGASSFAQGNFTQAVQHYSAALTFLPADTQPAEAGKLHSNRALCLLKLALEAAATAPTAAPHKPAQPSAPAAAPHAAPALQGPTLTSDSTASPYLWGSSCPHRAATQLAAAVVEDCSAALTYCDRDLAHKVLYRRAQAQMLQQHYSEAASDCQAAIAAAQESGAAAAALQDCQQLLQLATAAESAHTSKGKHCCKAPAVAPSQQQEQQQQQHLFGQLSQLSQQQNHQQGSKEQPPSGCSLQQLDMLLAYLQHQAQDLLTQQQQEQQHDPQGVSMQSPVALLQQQYRVKQQQRSQAAGAAAKCSQQEQEKGPSICCSFSPAKGRHLLAARDIPAGSVLLAELPLAAVAVKPKRQPQAHEGRAQQQQLPQGRCSWCFTPLGPAIWPCSGCPLASYCSPACQHAAGSASSLSGAVAAASHNTAGSTGDSKAGSTAGATVAAAAGLQPGLGCAEHAAGGLECGRPWVRLLPEEAILASRCLRARAAAAAAAAAAAMVVAPATESAAAGDEQQVPQQWQELCLQQQQLRVDVLAATLLDSLVYHPSPRQAASSSVKPLVSEAVRTQQQQEQQVEQLVLASLVSQIHTQAADKQQTTSAASKLAGSSQHCTAASAAISAPAADPEAVLELLQQLVANGIAIKPFLSSGPEDRWGLGLYPVTAAVVNHSCDPNCSIRFQGRMLLLVCHRGAAAGEELTISYGPQLGLHSTLERQELLQQQYGFSCTCSSCCEGLQACASNTAAAASSTGRTTAATPVWQREAAAVGLRCCGGSCEQPACPGPVVPASTDCLPAGLVSLQPLPASSSTGLRGRHQASCTACGYIMPAGLLQQKLQELQAAAADADSAYSIMAGVQEQRHEQQSIECARGLAGAASPAAGGSHNQQEQPKQLQRQLERVQKAVGLLRRATAVRQQHLSAGSQLLGHSHHAAAAAAVEAAVLADAALRREGSGRAACATAQDSCCLQQSLAVLQDSLSMRTEVEVCNVLMHLQQCVEAFVRAGVSLDSSSSRSTVDSLSVDAVLQLPCSCMQEGSAQLPVPQHDPAQARAGTASCSSRPAHAVSAQAAMQDSLTVAFQHFNSSIAVLACSQPQDSLALAVEKGACCAAGLALVAGMRQQDGCCAASPPGHERGPAATAVAGQQGIGVQGRAFRCCRCSAVLRVVADIVQDVVNVVAVHLGVEGCSSAQYSLVLQ